MSIPNQFCVVKWLSGIAIVLCAICASSVSISAQQLFRNGYFDNTTSSYTTGCTSIEATYYESTYGGTSSTNHVAEVDDESCFYQDVCILPGASYTFSMVASRRISSSTPSTVNTKLRILGLNSSGGIVSTYVDMVFSRSNTTFAFTPVTGIPTVAVPSGSGVVRLRVYLSDTTSGYDTYGMIVDSLSLTFVTPPAVTGSRTTCTGSPETFSVTGVAATGITYIWSFGAGASMATSTAASPTVSWSSTGVKTVEAILGNGVCYVDTTTYNVTVGGAVTLTRYDTTCINRPYVMGRRVYTISGIYRDTISSGGCDSIISLYLTVRPLDTTYVFDSFCTGTIYTYSGNVYSSPGVYPLFFTSSRTRCDSIVMLNLKMLPIPSKPSVTSPVQYCENETAVALFAGGAGLLWYTAPVGGVGATAAPVPVTTTTGSQAYYVSQTVSGCEGPRAQIDVVVDALPVPSFTWDIRSGCAFDTVQFNNSTQFATRYEWDFGDGSALISREINPLHNYSAGPVIHTRTVTLKAYNGRCAAAPLSNTITFAPMPKFTLTNIPSAITIAYGSSAQLNAGGAVTYYWQPNNGTLDDPNINNPLATPADTTIYTVWGYNAAGCLDSAQVQVNVVTGSGATLPSAFTPNNDGKNDVFRIVAHHFEKLVDFRIFNRWGALVFETNDIRKGWDGTIGGEQADLGVYYYQAILATPDGKNKELTGNVTLIR